MSLLRFWFQLLTISFTFVICNFMNHSLASMLDGQASCCLYLLDFFYFYLFSQIMLYFCQSYKSISLLHIVLKRYSSIKTKHSLSIMPLKESKHFQDVHKHILLQYTDIKRCFTVSWRFSHYSMQMSFQLSASRCRHNRVYQTVKTAIWFRRLQSLLLWSKLTSGSINNCLSPSFVFFCLQVISFV